MTVENRNYLRAARDLRRAISLNRQDTVFATPSAFGDSGGKSKRRIIYFCDTNVIEGYLASEDESVTPSLADLMSPSALKLSDRLTRQYMFSRALPLQDGGMFLSPDHWNELMDRLANLEATRRGEALRLNLVSEEEIEALKRLRNRPQDLIEEAKTIGLTRVLDRFRRLAETNQLLKLAFQGDVGPDGVRTNPKIQTMTTHEELREVADGTVRTDEFREWLGIITALSRPDRRSKRENIEVDAMTLALIQGLYRETPQSLGDDATVRFLFITSDWQLIRAFQKRYSSSLELEGIPNFVRHPLVYSPLINFSSIHRAMLGKDHEDSEYSKVFNDVALAISALFPDRGKSAEDAQERFAEQWDLVDNVKRWSAAAETIALTNGSFLSDVPLKDIDLELAQLFGSQTVVATAKDMILRTISEIQQNHTRNMASVSLDNMLSQLRTRRNGGDPRPPLLIRGIDLLAPFKSGLSRTSPTPLTISELMQQLSNLSSSGSSERDSVERIAEVMSAGWNEAPVQLLAANIYLADGAWDAALACARRCLELLKGRQAARVLQREARYTKALALRMLLRSEHDLNEADEALGRNSRFRFRNDDPLSAYRDSVERSALLVSACIVQTVERRGGMRRSDWREYSRLIADRQVADVFDDELQCLDDSIDMLEEEFGFHSDPHVAAIMAQAASNRLGAELFRKYFPYDISDVPHQLKQVHDRSVQLLTDAGRLDSLPLMSRTYVVMARLELGLPADAVKLAADIARKSQITKLAQGDLAEYAYITSRLQTFLDQPRNEGLSEDSGVAAA